MKVQSKAQKKGVSLMCHSLLEGPELTCVERREIFAHTFDVYAYSMSCPLLHNTVEGER